MRRAAAFALGLALWGCGYRFSAQGTLPGGERAVFVPIFVNSTAEPGLEASFTQALRQQLSQRGLEGGPDAKARVEGEVASLGASPTVLTTEGRLASYRLTATARLRLSKADKPVTQVEVTGTEDYLPGADVLLTEANRRAALQRLAEAMMREGYELLSVAW